MAGGVKRNSALCAIVQPLTAYVCIACADQVPQFVLEDARHRDKPNRLPLMYHALLNVLQVPQFILEDAWYRSKGCRVVCTQPRRISAVSGGWGLGSGLVEGVAD